MPAVGKFASKEREGNQQEGAGDDMEKHKEDESEEDKQEEPAEEDDEPKGVTKV